MKTFLASSLLLFISSFSLFAFDPGSSAQPSMGEQPGMQQPGEGQQPSEGQRQPDDGQQPGEGVPPGEDQPSGEGQQPQDEGHQPDAPEGMGGTFVYDTFVTESTGVGIDVMQGVWVSTANERTSIVSNSNLVEMAVGAAAGSIALAKVDLRMSSALTEVPSCAFAGCANLDTVILPISVTNVAADAFVGCPKLKSISYADGTTDPATPDQQVTPNDPVTQNQPTAPDEPITPDQPNVPDDPVSPDQPVTPDDPVEPDQPVPPEQPDDRDVSKDEPQDMSPMVTTYAQTFYGYVYDENGISGTLTVTTSKANSRTGLVTVKATIWLFGGKKSTVSAKVTASSDGPTTVAFADTAETTLALTANGLTGSCAYGTIVASRDFSKRKADTRYGEYDNWIGTRTCVFATDAADGDAAAFAGGYSTFAVRVAKKGVAYVTGTMGDGTTFSQSAHVQLSVDGSTARIPVLGRLYKSHAGGFGFVLALGTNDSIRIEAVAPWDASCRTGGGFAASLVSVTNGVPVKLNRKNAVLTADQLEGATVSSLTFSSNAKTGALRGSYRAVLPDYDSKRYSVTLRGVTVGDICYATSVIRKIGTFQTEVVTCSEP